MSVMDTINKWDKKYAWSLLGIVLAIVFGAITIYVEFIRKNAPLVEFELLGNTPVLDVREKLPDLEILYQKQDLSKSGQTLSVLLLRIVNNGTADLLINAYDNRAPLGLQVKNATLIRAEMVGASSDYLGKNASAHVQDSTGLTLDAVILEPNEWYQIKLLVIHNVTDKPDVVAQGKIAGMHNIQVVPVRTAEAERAEAERNASLDKLIRILKWSFVSWIALLMVSFLFRFILNLLKPKAS